MRAWQFIMPVANFLCDAIFQIGYYFPSKKFFGSELFNTIVGVSSLFLKLPMTRRLRICRVVQAVHKTKVWWHHGEVPHSERVPTVLSLFLLWIIYITGVTGREHHFGTGIVYGTIPNGFPVFWVVVPGCSRNSYGTSLNLWVQKKIIKFRQRTKMRDSVRLNCGESFFMTFPSISSETRVMCSLAIPGVSVFCNWLFPVYSSVSPETVANFLILLIVAIILRKKLWQLWRLNWLDFVAKLSVSSIMREHSFKQKQTVIGFKLSTIPKGYQFVWQWYNFHFSIKHTFVGVKHNLLHANSRYKYGKVL